MKKKRISQMSFGSKKERIKIIHLNSPIKYGFVGYVKSKLFKKMIPLRLDDSDDFEFASCDVYDDDTYVIKLKKEVFYDFKRGSHAARTIMFHEIGHLLSGGFEIYYGNSQMYDEDRYKNFNNGDILNIEIQADDFAVKYLGVDYVIQGLREIKDMLNIYRDEEDVDVERLEMASEELDRRIKRIEEL